MTDHHNNASLVLFSGGQDSTVCLAYALSKYDRVETIGFDYGQRHKIELECRKQILKEIQLVSPNWQGKLGEDHLISLTSLSTLSDTALTRDVEIVMTDAGLPNTFVPGRNVLFFTYAAALAYRRGIGHLIGGMCETDYSGYPDCRHETLQSVEKTLALATEKNFKIITPLMWMNKGETWAFAHELGGDTLIQLIIDETHSCYLGERSTKHDWGYGCGTCPACVLREKGYRAWQQMVLPEEA